MNDGKKSNLSIVTGTQKMSGVGTVNSTTIKVGEKGSKSTIQKTMGGFGPSVKDVISDEKPAAHIDRDA